MLRLRLLARHGQRNGRGTAQPHVLGAAILGRFVLEDPRSPLAAVADLQIEIPAIGMQAVLGGLYEPCRQFVYRHQSLCAGRAYVGAYLSLGSAFWCALRNNGAPMSTRESAISLGFLHAGARRNFFAGLVYLMLSILKSPIFFPSSRPYLCLYPVVLALSSARRYVICVAALV